MEKLSQEDFNSTLIDVRNAYRLLYLYQRRVMDIVKFIGDSFSLSYHGGVTRFSNTAPRSEGGNLDLWAWDWLNMYCYQFIFQGKTYESGNHITFGVFVISDTGFYDSRGIESAKLDIDSFVNVENSQTKFVFYLGCNLHIWDHYPDFFANNLRKDTPEYVIKNGSDKTFIAKSFNLVDFINEDSARNILSSWIKFCENSGITELKLVK